MKTFTLRKLRPPPRIVGVKNQAEADDPDRTVTGYVVNLRPNTFTLKNVAVKRFTHKAVLLVLAGRKPPFIKHIWVPLYLVKSTLTELPINTNKVISIEIGMGYFGLKGNDPSELQEFLE